MTFPGLSTEQLQQFSQREAKLVSDFLADPAVSPVFTSEKDLQTFERLRIELQAGNQSAVAGANRDFLALAQALLKRDQAENARQSGSDVAFSRRAQAFRAFENGRLSLENERRREHLKTTIGGRLGVALEWVFKPIGFDWRTNIALVGGFAAKEVVVATLGTAYSLGEIDPEAGERLADRLKKEPGWNPLLAFSLILFVMMYAPCIVTLAVIKKETGTWKWTLFATAYTTALAYTVALVVHSVGSLLGLGVA
jgi:ferrous iron transport protein B